MSGSRRFQLITLLRGSLILSALALYLVACVIIYAFQIRQNRLDVHFLLYSEAESLASYVASTGKLDFPELMEIEEDVPSPVWMRVVENGRVLAATPHFPATPLATPAEVAALFDEHHPAAPPSDGARPAAGGAGHEAQAATETAAEEKAEAEEERSFLTVQAADGRIFPLVRHEVWNRPGTYVEALTRSDAAQRRMHRLVATLMLTGLILVPCAAVVAELLSRQLLRPIEGLIGGIRGIETQHLGSRLPLAGRVAEIAHLTEEFNQLLGRVEAEVRRMRRFTANASHELRTPIASLRAGIDVCLRRPRSAEEYRSLLEESLHEIDRVQRVVEGLLALAREPEGGHSAQRERVELEQLVERACRVMQPLAGEKQVALRAGSAGAPAALGDEAQLELMLINLIDNAIRHSPRQSEVAIFASRQDGWARLEVADRGPGIPAAERAAIFDRHYQGSGDGASPRVGGIGLDLVRWVVEVHGGQVRVIDAPAPGARFEILLPAA